MADGSCHLASARMSLTGSVPPSTHPMDSRGREPIMSTLPPELQTLEYYTRRAARRTLVSRIVLLTVIFGMLSANMWLTQRNYESMLINVNQARLAQDQLHDTTAMRLDEMERQLLTLQRSMDLLQQPVEVAAMQ